MRAFGLWMLLTATLIGTSAGQNEGWNVIRNSPSVGGNTVSSAYVDVLPFYNDQTGTPKDFCAAINAALRSITAPSLMWASVTIDARGVPLNSPTGIITTPYLACMSNPFSSLITQTKAYTGRLLLGQGPIITSNQWTMPNQYFWIEGLAMSNSSTPALGSVIEASGGGATGINAFMCATTEPGVTVTIPTITGNQCPVVLIAGSSVPPTSYFGDVLGSGIRNLTIDCNKQPNCVGVGSFDIQEGGGIDTVEFINQDTACVVFDSSAWSPPQVAISNPFIRNVDCVFAKPTGTVPTPWIGLYINATDGPAEISNTTVAVPGVMVDTPQFLYCLYLARGKGVNIN